MPGPLPACPALPRRQPVTAHAIPGNRRANTLAFEHATSRVRFALPPRTRHDHARPCPPRCRASRLFGRTVVDRPHASAASHRPYRRRLRRAARTRGAGRRARLSRTVDSRRAAEQRRLPRSGRPPRPVGPARRLAARTRRIALASGAIVLPLRHPLHIAKGALSVATLSGGRFILGASAPATARLNMQRSASTQRRGATATAPTGTSSRPRSACHRAWCPTKRRPMRPNSRCCRAPTPCRCWRSARADKVSTGSRGTRSAG